MRLFPNAECGLLFTPFLSLEDEETEMTKVSIPAWRTLHGLELAHPAQGVLSSRANVLSNQKLRQAVSKEGWHYINEDILSLKIENITAETHILHD